jgi:hypothetical protein
MRVIASLLLLTIFTACSKNSEVNEMKPADTITLIGRKPQMIMQSPMSPPMSSNGEVQAMWYLNLNGEPGKQVTLYSKQEPSCPGDIEVIGRPRTVIASKGGQDQTFTQYDVVSWRCL